MHGTLASLKVKDFKLFAEIIQSDSIMENESFSVAKAKFKIRLLVGPSKMPVGKWPHLTFVLEVGPPSDLPAAPQYSGIFIY